MTKNWDNFPKEQPYGEDLANFSCYRLYEKSAIAGYGVLSGCVVSRTSATEVAAASGTFAVAGVKKTFAGASLTSIAAAASGKHRYDLVYIDGADDTLKLAAGTEDTPTSATDFLENYVPRPAAPTDTDWIVLAVIRVTESGIENTNFGTNQYATGSVANMKLGPGFAVDDSTLQVVDGVASIKSGYVKTDGTTPLTGNWDVGAFKVTASQLESDVAEGTAPLVVASDTVVSNLNADKLDGNEASAFAVAAKGVTGGDSHDSLHSAAFAALSHASRHKSGGADSIRIDELAAPTDVTTLDASTSAHGLMPKFPNTKTWLRGDKSWQTNKWGYEVKFGDGSGVISNQSDTSRAGIKACTLTKVVIRSTDGAASPALVADTLTVTLYIHDYNAEEGTAVDTFSLSSASSYLEGSLSHSIAADKWITLAVSGASASKCLVVSLEFEAA